MRCYRVDIGGATYWVAADNKERAVDLARATMEDDCKPAKVSALSAEQLAGITIRGVGVDESLADAFAFMKADGAVGVIACTEWP